MILQQSLDQMQLWLLRFHPNKCKVLTLRAYFIITHTHEYTLCMSCERDLGVMINERLKFYEHIYSKMKRLNRWD